jgi:hypothetical protein
MHHIIQKAVDDDGNKTFDEKNRKGSKKLEKAGYVEHPEFAKAVLKQMSDGKVTGYFCANCEYLKRDSKAKYKVVCKKLNNAEDAPWGCCNHWEFEPK